MRDYCDYMRYRACFPAEMGGTVRHYFFYTSGVVYFTRHIRVHARNTLIGSALARCSGDRGAALRVAGGSVRTFAAVHRNVPHQ
jgi:hypothetical protein